MPKSKKYPLNIISDTSNNPLISLGSGSGKVFVEKYFPQAENEIRIASSYFNLKGYEIGNSVIKSSNVRYKILVGGHGKRSNRIDAKEVQKAILSSIKEELNECHHLWAKSIQSLVNRLNEDSFIIKEAGETNDSPLFHVKFYIIDCKFLFHGSANFSGSGLQNNAEQMGIISENNIITQFIEWFDTVQKGAKDLKKELLDLLEAWLKLSKPFDIYLKTMHFLLDWDDSKTNTKYQPNYYQKIVIQNAYKQIKEYGGSLIIAATGLGKTIMAAEIAHRLHEEKKSKVTIILAPPNVYNEWEEQFDERNIHHYFFSISILFKGDKDTEKDHHKISKLKELLSRANEFTTIIIDEVHLYKNQKVKELTDEKTSSVYERLLPAIKKKAKVMLLTATPYSSNIFNVDSILNLLPHNAPKRTNILFEENSSWSVKKVELLADLPIVTIIGLPRIMQLSRQRGDLENGRIFVKFGEEKRYFPKQIIIIPSHYKLFLQDEIECVFNKGLFDSKIKNRKNLIINDQVQSIQLDILQNVALSSWLSSPPALEEAIKQNICTDDTIAMQQHLFDKESKSIPDTTGIDSEGYSTKLKHSKAKRHENLYPLLGRIENIIPNDDKFLKLKDIIKDRYELGSSKILIFVNRYKTGIYLYKLLNELYKGKVTSTIEQKDKNLRPKLKQKYNRIESIRRFSPKSTNYNFRSSKEAEFDILICTDADGVGLNLQDCDTIVNYDLPETADNLFQRLGRILRMTTNSERITYFYSLMPNVIIDTIPNTHSPIIKKIKDSFEKLKDRHNDSQSILGTAIMSNSNSEKVIDLTDDKIFLELSKDGGYVELDKESDAESQISHHDTYEKYKNRVNPSTDFIHSCMLYNDRVERLVILLTSENKYIAFSYNIAENQIDKSKSNYALLNRIKCKVETPTYFRQAAEIEQLTKTAIELWCSEKKASINNIRKICAILLVPKENKNSDSKKTINKFLDPSNLRL